MSAGMTPGDAKAEADRLAKVRGPAYAEGYKAALAAAVAALRGCRDNADGRYESALIAAFDIAIEVVDDLGAGQ